MKRTIFVSALFLIVIILSGCLQQPEPQPPAPPGPTTQTVVKTMQTSLGEIMVGTNGFALYDFRADTGEKALAMANARNSGRHCLFRKEYNPRGKE